jgi:hypothetical protein
VLANATNKPEISIMATSRDRFIREDGQWKFLRREIVTDIPAPRQAAPSHQQGTASVAWRVLI